MDNPLHMDNLAMDSLQDTGNHHLLTMVCHHKDLPSFTSTMMMMMEPPACSVEQTPTTSQEEQLDAWPLLGAAVCFISQVSFVVYHAAWTDVRMCS